MLPAQTSCEDQIPLTPPCATTTTPDLTRSATGSWTPTPAPRSPAPATSPGSSPKQTRTPPSRAPSWSTPAAGCGWRPDNPSMSPALPASRCWPPARSASPATRPAGWLPRSPTSPPATAQTPTAGQPWPPRWTKPGSPTPPASPPRSNSAAASTAASATSSKTTGSSAAPAATSCPNSGTSRRTDPHPGPAPPGQGLNHKQPCPAGTTGHEKWGRAWWRLSAALAPQAGLSLVRSSPITSMARGFDGTTDCRSHGKHADQTQLVTKPCAGPIGGIRRQGGRDGRGASALLRAGRAQEDGRGVRADPRGQQPPGPAGPHVWDDDRPAAGAGGLAGCPGGDARGDGGHRGVLEAAVEPAGRPV